MEQELKSAIDSHDQIPYAIHLKGLSEENIRAISADMNEPEWMLEHRLNSLKLFNEIPMPSRGPDLSGLDLDNIVYYARAEKGFQGYSKSWDEVDPKIKAKFERLGIPEAEKKYLAGAGGQYDAEVVYHNIKTKWAEK